jgi:hypothetical protein
MYHVCNRHYTTENNCLLCDRYNNLLTEKDYSLLLVGLEIAMFVAEKRYMI